MTLVNLSDSLPRIDALTFPDDYIWSDDRGAWVEKDDPTKEAELAVILYYYLTRRRRIEQALKELTEKLLEKKLTPKEWHKQTLEALMPLYTLTGWLAMGANPSEDGLTAINDEYQFHKEKLQGFLDELGEMSETKIAYRSTLYPEATIAMLHSLRHKAKTQAGYKFSRRFLSEAEHCPDCVRYASMGKKPIGVLPPPGSKSACLFNCKCRIEYYRE